MESLGKYLRENREARGITLEEIERVSNIGPLYLHALEKGHFHMLPAPAFTIGFLRQYARCVGLDPEEVVLRYRTAVRQAGGRLRESSIEKTGRGRRRSIWILGPSLLVLGVLWMYLYPGTEMTEERVRTIRVPRSSPKEIRKETLKKELGILEQVPPGEVFRQPGGNEGLQGPHAEGGEEKGAFAKTGSVEVILHALKETKVQVRLDDGPPSEEVLEQGGRRFLRAKERVRLKIENAGDVRIFYNGKAYENLGSKGDVVQIEFPPAEAG